jgi:hypothetical protein
MTKSTKTKTKPKILTGLTLEDFMTDTNLSTPSKMTLFSNKVKTDHYLSIVGAQSLQVTRARLTWGHKTQALTELLKSITDDIDRAVRRTTEESAISNAFALELITGWSFGDYKITKVSKLLSDNIGLADAVISFAFAKETTLAKK